VLIVIKKNIAIIIDSLTVMPKLTQKWNENRYTSYFDNFNSEYEYIFKDKKIQIANKDNFTLYYYKQNNTFAIFDDNTQNIAGVFFTYEFSFDEILENTNGILVDLPVIVKEYRGKQLALWAYKEIHKFFKLPIVASNNQTESILYSVWFRLGKEKKVTAKRGYSCECVYNWNESCINITHRKNSTQWYLIYED